MTARSVPMASLYLIASLSISLAAIAVLAGVSPLSAVMRAAVAFMFFSALGWVALFTLRTTESQETAAEDQDDGLGTHVDVSVGPEENEQPLADGGQRNGSTFKQGSV